jgi:hypothetical protein
VIRRSNDLLKSLELLAPDGLLSFSTAVMCDQSLPPACASSRQQPIGTLATTSVPEKRRFFIVENIEILRE